MNEERRKAYLNLINALLNCPSGEEPQILNANQDLVDAGLVETILLVAKDLIEQGNLDAANFLMNLAGQLMGVYGNTVLQRLPSSPPTSSLLPNPKSQLTFLLKVLQATAGSNGNPQVVYPLLQANLDKLDDNLAQLLRSLAKTALVEVTPEQAHSNAIDIGNCGDLIRDFSLGNRACNLEIALVAYEIVSTFFTYQAFPLEWAKTQNDLGNTYFYRIRGERAKNLELAIRYYLAALEVYTQQAFPEQWAGIQNNLGNAYLYRIQGEKAENLEAAIRYYSAALEIRSRHTFPQDWARTQNNLGNAYLYRIQGEKAENLEAAIRYYSAALEIRSRHTFPQDWARTQNNLGNAYLYRIQGEKAENLEVAIGCYIAALEVLTHQAFFQDLAETQNNLGEAYRLRICGERAENLEAAIGCYIAALEVLNRQALPKRWAMTQNNLGNAYSERMKGKREENLEAAIACYIAALEVLNRQAFPEEHVKTQYGLGVTYQDVRQFHNAYIAFAAAIDTVESLRLEIVSGNEVKQKLAEEYNRIYLRLVEVSLELGYYNQAIEYVERSKTRNLVELVLTRDCNSIFPSEIASQLEKLRDEIASGQYQLQTATADNPTALAQHLQQLRQQRNQLQDRYLPIGYGFKFDQFQATLDDHTAIIEWYITSAGIETFIFTRDSLQQLILPAPDDNLNDFVDWVKEYLEAYDQKKTDWINSLASRLSRLAEILHLENILELVPDTCSRLILIPHRFLHLFPLHALPLANGDFLCDRFSNGVGYAPSCQLLQLAQKRERPDFSNLFAIQNPTDDLLYSNLEVEVIRSSFSSTHILLKQAATKTAFKANQDLPSVHCTHFSCHGTFNLASPLESALILANNERLTLGEIFALTLNQCRLVTLSACETGLSDPNSLSDEYISLPSGFLYAGALGVVSSLWAVSDLSTCFLMIKFYENLKNFPKLEAGDVAIALNQAQLWLRDLTSEEFEAVFAKYQLQIDKIVAQLSKGDRFEFQDSLEQARKKIQAPDRQPKPFANPYYWAAFTATGL